MRDDNAPVLAVDIGGSKILLAVIRPGNRLEDRELIPTRVDDGVDAIINRICAAMSGLLKRNGLEPQELTGIGIACAGGIDTSRSVVVTPSPNLPDWINIPLAKIIKERFGVDTYVINDASAAAYGEFCIGAGRDVDNLVLFTLGTGIGGGIITDGRLYLGARGGAGELGHMTIAAEGPKCHCGNIGCLEMLASGKAIERDAVNRLKSGEKSVLTAMVNGDIEKVTAEMVGRAAGDGDKLSLEVLEKAAYYLGIGMVNVTNIFNPDMIVCGGGMAELGDLFIGPGKKMVQEMAFSISAGAVRIVTAELGNEAGVYGVATYVREQQERRTA